MLINLAHFMKSVILYNTVDTYVVWANVLRNKMNISEAYIK